MKKVLLDNVRTGMTTAEPVKTKKGQILAGAGTVLNSNHISRFTYYHIESVMIKDEDVMDSEVPEYQEDNKKQRHHHFIGLFNAVGAQQQGQQRAHHHDYMIRYHRKILCRESLKPAGGIHSH